MLDSVYFGSKISSAYNEKLTSEAQTSLKRITKYFDKKGNAIDQIRNYHAFHYNQEKIAGSYAETPDLRGFNIYSSESNINTLYAFSDFIVANVLMHDLSPQDHNAGLEQVMTDTSAVAGDFNTFLGCCILISLQTYLKPELLSHRDSFIHIGSAPHWDHFVLPYFFEEPSHFKADGNPNLTWGAGTEKAPNFQLRD